MGEYLPYAGNHSIQEAQVGLQFHHEFNQQEIERARSAAEADLKGVLPRSAEIRGGSVTVDLSNPDAPAQMGSVSSTMAGFQLSKVMGDGRPARALQLSGNLVSVNIVEYDGWDNVQAETIRYITTVLTPLDLELNPVVASSLRYIDRYTFNGSPDDVQANLLFADNNGYLAPRCFTVGSLWHCHTGWFESLDAGRVLNNLNVASSIVDLSPTVTIDHQATLHLATPRQSINALLSPSAETLGLVAALNALHERNKTVLSTMLLPEILDQIGIEK